MDVKLLVIDGTEKEFGRRRIIINDSDLWIQGKLFKYLLRLAVVRPIGDGWLPIPLLEPAFDLGFSHVAENVMRLRRATALPIRNRRRGAYLLDIAPDALRINAARLIDDQDFDVSSAFDLVKGHNITKLN